MQSESSTKKAFDVSNGSTAKQESSGVTSPSRNAKNVVSQPNEKVKARKHGREEENLFIVCQLAMIFPFSSRPQLRTLVLRNTSNRALYIKVITSNQRLLMTQKREVFCDVSFSVPVKILLNSEMLGANQLESNEYVYVYCIVLANRTPEEVRAWVKGEQHTNADLAYKLHVVRSRDFAALETIVELPGNTCPVRAVSTPSYDVDDSDCRTAHNVDSDTDTVVPLSDNELLAVLPTDSLVKTATDGKPGSLSIWLQYAIANLTSSFGKQLSEMSKELPSRP